MDDGSWGNPVSQPVRKAALSFDFTDPEVKSKSENQKEKPALSINGSGNRRQGTEMPSRWLSQAEEGKRA